MYSVKHYSRIFLSGELHSVKRFIISCHVHAKSTGALFCDLVNSPDRSADLSNNQLTGRNKTLKSKPQKQVCQLVLDHFDAQYCKELGHLWPTARAVLLNPHCWQYGVMLNRFSDLAELQQRLQTLGYCSLLPHSDSSTQTTPNSTPLPDGVSSSLQCLVHPSPLRLPSQGHHPGRLKQYYLLNAASLLPVLALGLREGDRVLDLCSAPGGKALAMLQSASPGLLHCNEADAHRHDWLSKTLESFVPPALNNRIRVTNLDGRGIGSSEPGAYDKVLVDAPCSNDKSWLFTPRHQQGELWLRERAHLPQLQKELLRSALAAVRPGGVVVYSTCTLSRAENQGVVEAVLASCLGVELQDLGKELIGHHSDHFAFAPHPTALGVLVVPEPGRTWGPIFLSRLKRVH